MKSICILLVFSFLSAVFLIQCQKSASSGQALYNTHCANCHLGNGQGLGELIPSIVNSPLLVQADSLACMIRNGVPAKNPSNSVFEGFSMPPNQQLSEIEITNILNYAIKEFSNSEQQISFPKVKKSLESCN